MPERADLERRTTELLQRLIRFDTVNPPGNEEEAQHFLKRTLEGAGFECELLTATEGRPNLVARLKGGSDGPRLALAGHVDTVLADASHWSVDPWSGELRDGCVWGRGAIDMKNQVAAEVAAATALAEEGWRPEAGELMVVVTADEEAGGACGARWLCSEHPESVRCDIMINEGAGPSFEYDGLRRYGVCVAEKGICRFTVTAHGVAGHAMLPRIGDNALVKLAPVLEALRGGRPAVYEHTAEGVAFLESIGLPTDDLQSAVEQLEEKDPRIAVLLEPMLGVTFTPTMASASEKINVIPARAELRVDCRVPPEGDVEHVRERMPEALEGDDISVNFGELVKGNRSPVDTPVMDFIRDFVKREEPGADVAPCALPGFADSNWFRAAFPDCTAYGFFPMREMDLFESTPLIHGADERIPVADLGLAASFYSELCQEMLR